MARAIGPFKRSLGTCRARACGIGADLEKTFTFLFEQLRRHSNNARRPTATSKPKLCPSRPRAALVSRRMTGGGE